MDAVLNVEQKTQSIGERIRLPGISFLDGSVCQIALNRARPQLHRRQL
jgi:hypothetical protein